MLAWFIMQSRMEVAIAKEREELANTKGALEAQKAAMEESIRGAEEAARRKALDEFMADIRIEQRHYIRQNKILFLTRKCLVLEERIFFRNLPLSNWIEHEIMLEEGADVERVARTLSVFEQPEVVSIDAAPRARKLLH